MGQMPFLTPTGRNTLGFAFSATTTTSEDKGASLPFVLAHWH